ncbi:MAG: hypothetical protein AAEF23_05165 [Gammaproteobacteria bacterium]
MTQDFSLFEINIVKNTVNERWGEIEIELADVEVSRTSNRESTPYPALVWEASKCTFVVIKVDDLAYKCIFYYLGTQRFDTGVNEYDDLHSCVMSIMKTQANFLLTKNNDINVVST